MTLKEWADSKIGTRLERHPGPSTIVRWAPSKRNPRAVWFYLENGMRALLTSPMYVTSEVKGSE